MDKKTEKLAKARLMEKMARVRKAHDEVVGRGQPVRGPVKLIAAKAGVIEAEVAPLLEEIMKEGEL